MNDEIEQKFTAFSSKASDINEHLPRLCELARQCARVTEFGVGWSTWAFLHARPSILRCYDILSRAQANQNHRGTDLDLQERLARQAGIDFRFTQADTRVVVIDQTDLLFIDTHHVYDQLRTELGRHGHLTSKFIAMHDTTICPDMWPAIDQFLSSNSEWSLLERRTNNNGLTVLARAQPIGDTK